MQKSEKNLNILMMVFGALLITSNAIASKIWSLGFDFLGSPVAVTVGALSYPFIAMIMDTINELYGNEKAKLAVKGGFICQFISTVFIVIAGLLPATDTTMQDSFKVVLGQSWVFVIASLVAYLVSSYSDILIFGTMKKRQMRSGKEERQGRSTRAYVSTIIGQLIDSTLFVGIAFGLGFGWLWNGQVVMMLNMILIQWLIKTALSYIGIPLFARMTAPLKNK